MSLVKIGTGEWYPVFDIDDVTGKPTEVPDDLLRRMARTEKAFIEAQDEIAKLYDEQHGTRYGR